MLEHFYSRKDILEKAIYRAIQQKKEPKEVYGLISEFIDLGGKRFRPLLLLSTCSLVGGKIKDAINAAVAIELFHNFTLIHDDIEDNSILRRGKECLHIKYGLPLAINAGDGLFMLVWKEATKIKKHNLAAQQILLKSFTSVLEGQAIELSWYRTNNWNLDQKDYFNMAGGKTASLISGASELGALLGDATAKQRKLLAEFGYNLGLAFQIQDDILNLVGTEEEYKKEVGGDIKEGKRTLIILHCLKNLQEDEKTKLKEILTKKENTEQEIKWVIEKVKQTKSIDYAKNISKQMVDRCLKILDKFEDNQDKQDLRELALFTINRRT